jgi:hypothetical protein
MAEGFDPLDAVAVIPGQINFDPQVCAGDPAPTSAKNRVRRDPADTRTAPAVCDRPRLGMRIPDFGGIGSDAHAAEWHRSLVQVAINSLCQCSGDCTTSVSSMTATPAKIAAQTIDIVIWVCPVWPELAATAPAAVLGNPVDCHTDILP